MRLAVSDSLPSITPLAVPASGEWKCGAALQARRRPFRSLVRARLGGRHLLWLRAARRRRRARCRHDLALEQRNLRLELARLLCRQVAHRVAAVHLGPDGAVERRAAQRRVKGGEEGEPARDQAAQQQELALQLAELRRAGPEPQ